jgi:hypothetical protein
MCTTAGGVPAKSCPRGFDTTRGRGNHHRNGGCNFDPTRRAPARAPAPHLEALELRDFNIHNIHGVRPAQDADAFPDEALTEADIEALFVAKMERRDRLAACPAVFSDAACEACCGCALYVPVGQGGDILCPQCQREG